MGGQVGTEMAKEKDRPRLTPPSSFATPLQLPTTPQLWLWFHKAGKSPEATGHWDLKWNARPYCEEFWQIFTIISSGFNCKCWDALPRKVHGNHTQTWLLPLSCSTSVRSSSLYGMLSSHYAEILRYLSMLTQHLFSRSKLLRINSQLM